MNQLFTVLDAYKSQEWTFWSVSECLLSNWGDLSSLTFPTHFLFDKGAVSNKYNQKLLQKSILTASMLSPPFFTAGSSFIPPALLFLLQLEFFFLWLIPPGSGLSGDHLHPDEDFLILSPHTSWQPWLSQESLLGCTWPF